MSLTNNNRLLHRMESGFVTKVSIPIIIVTILLSLILGVASGFATTTFTNSLNGAQKMDTLSNDQTSTDSVIKTAGIKDTKTFPDQAEGIMREGGFEGEGSFHLERPGGKSQNAYLTSSTIDLSEFIGQKVRVWGATFRATKAGWLMDVGYLEVL